MSSYELDLLGRFLAGYLALEYQPGRARHLIDNKWGCWRSVDSSVKINQSEGIHVVAAALPEEGR